jgi:hypothetical protein
MEPKVTVTEYAIGDVYKVLGQISEAARMSRADLGELPLVHVTHRKKAAMTVVPAWLGQWIEEHATEVMALIRADEREQRRASSESSGD